MNRKENTIRILWYIGIFLFMYIWFSQVHPLVIYDADDWSHISFTRSIIPDLNKWNPAKVFPEIFMSFTSMIAAWMLNPFVNDYVLSVTIMSAAMVSTFITLYIYCLGKCLKRIFAFDDIRGIYGEILFIALHFLIFRNGDSGNNYLFHCVDLTCYYNYLIPALFNASIVLCMIKNEKFDEFLKNGDWLKQGIFFVIIYFAIFSNLVDNAILVAYVVIVLLERIIQRVALKRINWKNFLKLNYFYLGIIFSWCVCTVFEVLGGRAALADESTGSYAEKIESVIRGFGGVVNQMHKFFIFLMGAIIGVTILLLFVERKNEKNRTYIREFVKLAIIIVIMFAYMVMITAKVNAGYISRSEYVFAFFFYILLFETMSFGYVLKKFEKSVVVVPIILCVTISFINTNLDTFRESNQFGVSGKMCMDITRDLVQQVIDADKNGETSVTLAVSESGGNDNWPQATYMGEDMSIALYKHGITKRKIHIMIEPSTEYNEKYQLYQ